MNAVCDLNHFAKAKYDEPGRQRALDRLKVVDSRAEPPFERIVDLVKTTLNAPICAVTLVDNDRQWFKAFRGLNVDQTPRDVAFCDHAIRAEAPFIVEDATKDARFANNPLVLFEPHIRAYLGIPLKMPDGYMRATSAKFSPNMVRRRHGLMYGWSTSSKSAKGKISGRHL